MPKMTEEERYSDTLIKIQERETAYHSQYAEWNKLINLYRMETKIDNPEDSVRTNYFLGLSRIVLPSLYYKNPEVIVSPRNQTPREVSKIVEDLLNYQLEEMDFETEMRQVIFDTLFFGRGVMKFGFYPALLKKRRKNFTQEGVDTIFQNMFERGMDVFTEEAPPAAGEPRQTDERITKVNPFAIRVAPQFFLIDPLATTLKDARWVCHRILKPLHELKEDKRYPDRLVSGIEATHEWRRDPALNEVDSDLPLGTSMDPTIGRDPRYRTGYGDMVVLYEFWDKERDELLVLDSFHMTSTNEKKFLRADQNPYDIEGFPFEMLVFNPDPHRPDGVSDAVSWYNLQEAMNQLDSYQFNHVKRFSRKYVIRKDVFIKSPGAKERLQSGEDGAIIEVEGDPNGAVAAVEDAPISGDLYALRGVLQSRLDMLSGVTEPKRGEVQKTKTATEASILEGQSRLRESDRLYMVSKFVENSARILLGLDRQFLPADYVAFLTSPEAIDLWSQQSREMLRAEVDVKVRVGSSAFVSKEVRAKQILDFINLTAKLPDPMTGLPVLNIREAVKRAAEALEIEEPETLLMDPTMMMGPQMGMVQGGMGGPVQPGRVGQGTPNLGNQLSAVQGGRNGPPNPTNPASDSMVRQQ